MYSHCTFKLSSCVPIICAMFYCIRWHYRFGFGQAQYSGKVPGRNRMRLCSIGRCILLYFYLKTAVYVFWITLFSSPLFWLPKPSRLRAANNSWSVISASSRPLSPLIVWDSYYSTPHHHFVSSHQLHTVFFIEYSNPFTHNYLALVCGFSTYNYINYTAFSNFTASKEPHFNLENLNTFEYQKPNLHLQAGLP